MVYVKTFDLFFQDAWQFSHKLTFNYGVRWDYEGPLGNDKKDLSVFLPSKGGLVSVMKALAVELGRHGIRANAILPGWIDTPMTERTLRWDRFVERVLPRVPARRWGAPEDFGGIAVYLASDASRYHTGDTFVVDGGYSVF